MNKTESTFWDRIGISLSAFCAVHCLLVPVVIALLPLWPMAETLHDWTHPLLFVLIVPTVWFALDKEKLRSAIAVYLFAGLIIIGAAWIFHDFLGDWGEALVTLSGSTLLVTGHWKNYKTHQQKCEVQHEAA